MAIVLTRDYAWASSKDAGNMRMRKFGRTTWDVEDYNHAVATFNRLWPIEKEFNQEEK